METVRIPCSCFKSGDYTNIGRSIYTEQDLNTIVSRTNSYGLQAVKIKDKAIPLTLEHSDSENTIDLGEAIVGSFSRAGEYINAMLEIPKAALEIIKSRYLSVEISPIDKIIRKITITADPVISDAKFAQDVTKEENVECFSFSISPQGDSNMIEDQATLVTENVDEVGVEVDAPTEVAEDFSLSEDIAEAVLETVEAVLEEAIVETVVKEVPAEEMPSEEMATCEDPEKEDEEMGMTEDQKRIAELEAKLAELEDEKWASSVEAYSKEMVSKGIPPVIAKEMAPWLAMEGVEKFSKHSDYVASAKKVIEYFADPNMFSVKLTKDEGNTFLGNDDESFSDTVKINTVKAACIKEGIELYSDEYRKRLASAMMKQA